MRIKQLSIFLCLSLVLNSCLRDYELAIYTINSFQLSPATTATSNGMPTTAGNNVDKDLFALELNFQITDNLEDIDYNAAESTSQPTNIIDSVRVWSNVTFCGKPAGTALNSCFYVLKDKYAEASRLQDNSGLSLFRYSSEHPYFSTIHFVCDSEPDAGNYTFYTELLFKDGTSMLDSTSQITLE